MATWRGQEEPGPGAPLLRGAARDAVSTADMATACGYDERFMDFRHDYWDDPVAREAFKVFLQEIHGLDFSAWEAAGQWDAAYRPFSFFDRKGAVVSSVCAYEMDLVVDGRHARALQLSGVGTHPGSRRKGLNRELTTRALDVAGRAAEFVFLFADEEARPFYARCGFQPVAESRPSASVAGRRARSGLRKLDPLLPPDWSLLESHARCRTPVSLRLGVLHPKLLMFHVLYTLADRLYHLPALEVIVALEHVGTQLFLYDVIGPRIPTLAELRPYLAREETEEVVFQFLPDRLEPADLRWTGIPESESGLHDRGDHPLRGERFLFPFTAHA